MKNTVVTHKDLARLVGVSETTIKSYRRKFTDCIPVASLGKPIRFTESALQVCLRIREYFDAGMSVEEARSRLAGEFTWISSQQPDKEDGPQAVVLPQDFTQAVSNLAKSMVTLTQQQGAMLRRMEELEKNLALPPAAQGALPGDSKIAGEAKNTADTANAPSSSSLGPGLSGDVLHTALARLERLDAVTEALQSAVSGLATAVASFQPSARQAEVAPAQAGAKIYRFPAPGRPERPVQHPNQHPDQAQGEARPPQDPPRQLLSLPLVVQGAQGGYIGAGGRSRGRFTLNDLKALLAYGREPSEQYALRWEYMQDAWWLVLEQPQAESPRQLRMQLRELATQRGAAVAEVAQLVDNNRVVHPAEFCAFVATLSGEL